MTIFNRMWNTLTICLNRGHNIKKVSTYLHKVKPAKEYEYISCHKLPFIADFKSKTPTTVPKNLNSNPFVVKLILFSNYIYNIDLLIKCHATKVHQELIECND